MIYSICNKCGTSPCRCDPIWPANISEERIREIVRDELRTAGLPFGLQEADCGCVGWLTSKGARMNYCPKHKPKTSEPEQKIEITKNQLWKAYEDTHSGLSHLHFEEVLLSRLCHSLGFKDEK